MDKIYNGEYKIESPFGERILPNGDDSFHYGEDWIGISNKIVIAPTSGRIVSSTIVTDKNNKTWEWGNYVKMDDLNGFYLFFCHLSKRFVFVGDVIKEEQPIGIEGSSGYSFGSHCHFEVRRKRDGVAIDPREYFKILYDWEIRTYRNITKERFGFDDNTIKHFDEHPYPLALYKRLALTK